MSASIPTRGQVETQVRLGLRENRCQFVLLVVVNAFVGAMVGMERTVLAPLGEQEFQLSARTAVLSFIIAFGITKAFANFMAGHLADRVGRRRLLIGGWVIAAPVPFLMIWAPTWAWVLVANALLGVSQGLTWSTTVIMKIDLVGQNDRGLAMGLNECAGYLAVAASAFITGWIAARTGLRPEPFYVGVVAVITGLGLSVFVRDTAPHVALASGARVDDDATLRPSEVFWKTTIIDRNLSSASQAGLVNNLNDGMAWGLFPLLFGIAGMTLSQIGLLAAIYPATWGLLQIGAGALSDRVGRKWLIAVGMWVQAGGIAWVSVSSEFVGFALGAALLGIGTAFVYPALLAVVGDVAHPRWRASALGVYRLWRDLGYAAGALIAGITADLLGLTAAVQIVAMVTFVSGVVVALRMRETLPRPVSVVLLA
jgi:MFS family permease